MYKYNKSAALRGPARYNFAEWNLRTYHCKISRSVGAWNAPRKHCRAVGSAQTRTHTVGRSVNTWIDFAAAMAKIVGRVMRIGCQPLPAQLYARPHSFAAQP